MDTATHRDLIGSRTYATLTDGSSFYAFLRFITPAGVYVFADRQGHEHPHPADTIASLIEAQHVCLSCEGKTRIVFDGMCADCKRAEAERDRKTTNAYEVCVDCNAANAFYTPRAARFLCARCHVQQGTLSGLHAESRVLDTLVTCKGQDESSELHDWRRVRGTRSRCRNCHTDRFE